MKQVVILVPDGEVNLSSITGTYEILTRADAFWQMHGNKSKLQVRIASLLPEVKLDEGFFSLHPMALYDVKNPDLIIIPSVSYDERLLQKNEELIHWMVKRHKEGAELVSMCSGIFLLAATGLLDGKICASHWNVASDFKRLFPKVDLQIDKLITAQNGIYTNGGGYSFLNMLLFLIEKCYDRKTAVFCSKIFQIDIERSSQSPFHVFHTQKNHGDELVTKAQEYIEENLASKISFEALASQLAVSRRNFDRRFVKATGNSPLEYWQRVKIEVAKKLLEEGRKTVTEVMYEIGYADDKAFRELFKRITNLSPLEYRTRFNEVVVSA